MQLIKCPEAVAVAVVVSSISEALVMIILGSVVFFAAIIDLSTQRIPNKITFPTILIGFICQAWLKGFSGLIFSLQGLGLGIGLFILPYMIGKMGAGDAKLMGAVGAFLGPKGVFIAFLYASIAGGIYALLLIFFHRQQFKGFVSEQYANIVALYVTRKFDKDIAMNKSSRPRLCYGLAIAAGTWLYIGLELSGISQLLPI
jgi:prepilin peptidase CpaA